MSEIIFDKANKDDIDELVRLRIAYMIDDFGSISEYERTCMQNKKLINIMKGSGVYGFSEVFIRWSGASY